MGICALVAGCLIFLSYRQVRMFFLPKENQTLRAELDALSDNNLYIVVNTTHNRLEVRQGQNVIHEALCSTGSGEFLAYGRRLWSFDTPRGLYHIKGKVVDPIWIKPNWAFVEEGEPIPSSGLDVARFDSTSLGAYAMQLGDGYLIHGTLYTNQIGTAVTHGCIRLDDEDLKTVYQLAKVNTPVYIY